jgi:septal ring factor EnvC (AmiA/AmiB activator)
MLRRVLFCLVLCTAAVALAAQSSIDERRKDLDRLRSSIEQTRRRIDALNRRESSAMKSLTSAQRQQHRLAGFIASLESELRALQDSAAAISSQRQATQSNLQRVQQAYNDATVRMMSMRSQQRGSQQQSGAPSELFRALTNSVTAFRRQMRSLQDSLQQQESLLSAYASTQASVKSTTQREQQRLATSITASQRQLQQLRTNKTALLRELKQKQASVSRLQSIIREQIARAERERRQRADAERRRRAADAARRGTPPPAEVPEPDVTTGPGYGARSLPWPTPSRSILHGYGTYTNKQTGTVFDNPGIDIKVPRGTAIACVASGTVSSVNWLPGFGSLVIVDHQNGYRSVYANLATVSVRQGSALRAGSTVGTSGENVDGELVHFELWRGRERVDPTRYLR